MSGKTEPFTPGVLLKEPSASKGYTFYPDAPPTMAQTALSIGADLFLIFAVGFTLFVGGKRVIAFAKRLSDTRAARTPESAPNLDGTPS